MFKHVINGISIMSVLDKRRACVTGNYPVRIKVHYQKNKKYYTTGKVCSIDQWQRMPNTRSWELLEMRDEIQACFTNIRKHVLELHEKGEFSLANLDKSLKRISGKSLPDFIKEKITELRNMGSIGTMESYQCTLANILKYGGDNLPIEGVTVEWLREFETSMLKSRSVNTVAINMRNIRAIMNKALKEDFIKPHQYPFGEGRYEIRTAEGVKKALSSEQIDKIKKFQCTDEALIMYRDLWLFIYYCNGINIADLILLKFENIIDGEVVFVREKTKRTTKNIKQIRAVITDEMQAIINKWGNNPHPDNYIFNLVEHSKDPEIDMARKKWFTKKFNQNLRVISAAIGIPAITSYTARHSYATVLKRSNVNIAFISESLGHTSLSTTQIYLDSFEKEERIKNAGLL